MSAAKRPETPSLFHQIEYRQVGDGWSGLFQNAARALFTGILESLSTDDEWDVEIATHDGAVYQGHLEFDANHDQVTLRKGNSGVRIVIDIDEIAMVKA